MLNAELLLSHALAARDNAYAPYSRFTVGAALLDEQGKIYCGCNVENVSYPCGTCAEAGAVAAMCADGGRKIREILIVAGGEQLISPCGACRQRIFEFSDENTVIHLANRQGVKKSYRIKELLPLAFDEEDLRHD